MDAKTSRKELRVRFGRLTAVSSSAAAFARHVASSTRPLPALVILAAVFLPASSVHADSILYDGNTPAVSNYISYCDGDYHGLRYCEFSDVFFFSSNQTATGITWYDLGCDTRDGQASISFFFDLADADTFQLVTESTASATVNCTPNYPTAHNIPYTLPIASTTLETGRRYFALLRASNNEHVRAYWGTGPANGASFQVRGIQAGTVLTTPIFQDAFNRQDSPSLGDRWQLLNGTALQVHSGHAEAAVPHQVEDGAIVADLNLAQQNIDVDWTPVDGNCGVDGRLLARVTDAGNYYGARLAQGNAEDALIIYKMISGVYSELARADVPRRFAYPYHLRFSVKDASLQFQVSRPGSVSLGLSANDLSIASGGAGMMAFAAWCGAPGPRSSFDNFSVSSADGLASWSSLAVDPIQSEVTVGVPFSVTLTALDDTGAVADADIDVDLSVAGAAITPNQLHMRHGVAAAEVILDAPGDGLVLSATAAGMTARSNPFTASGGAVEGTGYLSVIVRDAQGALLDGLSLIARRVSTNEEFPLSPTFHAAGNYISTGLQAGLYTLRATYVDGSIAVPPQNVTLRPGASSVTKELSVIQCPLNPGNVEPILLVPGFAGSSTSGCPGMLGGIPRLQRGVVEFDNPAWDISDEEFNFTPGLGKCSPWGLARNPRKGPDDVIKGPDWIRLRDVLRERDNNYQVGCRLFPVPWDWRVNLGIAAKDYLKKWIDIAKAATGQSKVMIVTHSTGALLARSYIASLGYAGDVDKLALIAPPNQGAAQLYWVREGGDLDRLSAETHDEGFYKNLIKDQLVTLEGALPLACFNWTLQSQACKSYVRAFTKNQIVSTGGLASTLPFLQTSGAPEELRFAAHDENAFLNCLNSCDGTTEPPTGCTCPPEGSRLASWNSDVVDDVRTRIFSGALVATVESIQTDQPSGTEASLYRDGVPHDQAGLYTSGTSSSPPEGDGTVSFQSVRIPGRDSDLNGSIVEPSQATGHTQTVGVLSCEVADFLLGWAQCDPPPATARQEQDSPPILSLSIQGRPQFRIVDANGASTGVDPATHEVEEAIPSSTAEFKDTMGEVELGNLSDGSYAVEVVGAWDEQYRLSVSFDIAGTTGSQEILGFAHAGLSSSFEVRVDSAGTSPIEIVRDPLAPTGLAVEPYSVSLGLNTRVRWLPSTSDGVSGYRVYARGVDEPTMIEIGEASGLSLDTNAPWAAERSTEATLFAVAAVNTGGAESFLLGTVRNDDRDGDGLVDADEFALGTDVANSDTDGDGLSDGDEVARGTSPFVSDTDQDGSSDGTEVACGSDPLDPASQPLAQTPNATNATTEEDTQTTSGLVLSRNISECAEVTHFKITSITNGTLFENDGLTPVTDGAFITFAQGNAGLRFTPAANFSGTGSFTVQASTNNADGGLGGDTVGASILVDPVADTPSVTDSTTNEDTQTTSGLVISRNGADGAEVTHFKITSITNGALFENDGLTPVTDGAFITFAQGNAGLRFTPAANLNSVLNSFGFTIEASIGSVEAGLGGGVDAASITVAAVNDPPSFTKGPDQVITQTAELQTIDNWATNISAGPPDEGDQTLSFDVSATGITGSLAFTSAPAVSVSGTLSYSIDPSTDGTANLSVTLSDNGESAPPNSNTSEPQTFTIRVNPILIFQDGFESGNSANWSFAIP